MDPQKKAGPLSGFFAEMKASSQDGHWEKAKKEDNLLLLSPGGPK